MAKRHILSAPRGGVTLNMTKRQAKKVLRAIDGICVDDPELSAVSDALRELLDDTSARP